MLLTWRLLDKHLWEEASLLGPVRFPELLGFGCTHPPTAPLMVLKACGMLMSFPFSDGELSSIFWDMWDISYWDRKGGHFYSFSSPLYLRQHTTGPEEKKTKKPIMWNFLQIHFNYFKCICPMANTASCFKFCSFLVLSRIWHLSYGLCDASVQPLVSKIRTCTCALKHILSMKHNLTGLLSPPSCKLVYFFKYLMPCLCMVIYLIKFQMCFFQFIQTSKVCKHFWPTFDVLEALSFATKQKICQILIYVFIIIIGDSSSGHDTKCRFIWMQQESRKFTIKYEVQGNGKLHVDKAAQ